MLTNKKWRAACAAAATMLSMAGSAWAQTQTFSTFSDDATVALWLFDDGWYAHTNLLDASVGMYDLRLLKGDLIDGKYGGALLCSADAETFNAYFAEWPGAVAPKKMRGPDGQPSGLWGPTLTPTRLIDALAGGAWTCEFWVLLTRPPKNGSMLLDTGYALDPGFDIRVLGGGSSLAATNAYAGVKVKAKLLDRLKPGQWHHIALVYTRGSMAVYVDGKVQSAAQVKHIARRERPLLPGENVSLALTDFGVFDASKEYDRFRQHRFNLAIGESRTGGDDIAAAFDEVRISSVARYKGSFKAPASFSRNYGTVPSKPAVATGPAPLFGREPVKVPIPLGNRRHLFIDDVLLERREGVDRVVNPPTDYRRPTRSTEVRGDISVIDVNGRIYIYGQDGYSSSKGYTRVYTSDDGLQFDAPDLGLFEDEGSTNNNIVITTAPMWARTFYDSNPNAHPEERFKMTGWLANRGIAMFVSPDGIHWRRNETLLAPLVSGGGAETFWDDQYGRYVTMLKRDGSFWNDEAPSQNGRVSTVLTTSEPMKTWPFHRMATPYYEGWSCVALTGEGDTAIPVNKYGQVYRSRAQKYAWAPDTYFAFVWRMGEDQIRRTDLCVSRNGLDWTSLADRGWYMDSDYVVEGTTMAEGMIQDGMIRRGDIIWQYAECCTGPHGDGEKFTVRVSQRFDGFVSLDAKGDGGEIVTKPLTFRAHALYLNIVSQGRTRAALLDWTYRPIDGFALCDCEPIIGDSTAYRVNWKGGSLEKLTRRPVRLQLALKDAKLFALQFE